MLFRNSDWSRAFVDEALSFLGNQAKQVSAQSYWTTRMLHDLHVVLSSTACGWWTSKLRLGNISRVMRRTQHSIKMTDFD